MKSAFDTQTSYEPPRTFPSPLRVYRIAAGFTQEGLAERAGITRVTISALERGEHVPQLATARALAAALDCGPDELFPPDDGHRAADEARTKDGADAVRKNMAPTPRKRY